MKRYKITKTEYKFDRFIFIPYLVLIIVSILSIWNSSGFDFKTKIYFKCDSMYCQNPIESKYCHEEWCRQSLIPRGEYGEKPDKYFNFLINWWYIFFIGCFVLNHLIHNRHWDFQKHYGDLND
jgi:hypothetical protein